MACKHQLSWYELIPVFSFIFLWGRCLRCKSKISAQYPLVELTTGLLFGALFLKFQDIFLFNTPVFILTYAYYAAVFSLLLVIAVYDIKHKIIPDALALILAILGFVGLFFVNIDSSLRFFPQMPSVLEFLSGVFITLPFFIVWLVSKGTWMGLGDAKLAVGLGWLFGISRAVSGVVIAFWMGAIVGLSLVFFSKKHGMRSEIPFAPYLVLGALIAFLFEVHLF